LVQAGFNPWTDLITRPMINVLLVLYVISFSQMGIAIILFTILVRLVTLPLTLKQLNQMRKMTSVQNRLREVQTRYAKDRTRISQETMRIYKEEGINPIGCLGPMVIQMPILFGLYRVLVQTLFDKPDDLVGLSEKIYRFAPFSAAYSAAPLDANFLWLDLSSPDSTNVVLPVLVFVTSWVQQKMTMLPQADPRQQANQNMMLWMMPLLIAFFSFTFPSGLALYWVVSNIIGIAIQYFVTGWGPLFPLFSKPAPASMPAQPAGNVAPKEMEENGSTRNDRPHRRRSNRVGAQRARRRPRRGRGRSTK
ncbi:MAG: YidC/Oxa1 family membrane protein insertase, partial [Chloroflexota bacterium]